ADVADALGHAGERVVHVLFVLQADVAAEADVAERLEDAADVEDASADLDDLGPRLAADEILEVDVVEPPRAGPDRLDRIDPSTRCMPDVDAEADPLIEP